MKSRCDGYGYNERLFAGGVRSLFHYARFNWLKSKIESLDCAASTVLELGCFDGKLIDFLPDKPLRYVGFDANWEGGLDLAVARFGQYPQFVFHKACVPDDMCLIAGDRFDIAIAMETLEHLPPELVDGYLQKICQHCDGYFFVTVPNEKGLVFLTKYLAKKILTQDSERYSFGEVVNATLCRLSRVSRREHKGFDYSRLVVQIERYFDVIEISGHPFRYLPNSLCFGIGIVAKARTPAIC